VALNKVPSELKWKNVARKNYHSSGCSANVRGKRPTSACGAVAGRRARKKSRAEKIRETRDRLRKKTRCDFVTEFLREVSGLSP
jgi:hypothetical protein